LQAPLSATLAPSTLNFGIVTVGKASSTQYATLKNTGGGPISISALAMGGANPTDFTRKGTCAVNATLSAGASCTITITFKPAAVGLRTASVAVTTSAGSFTLGLTGTGKSRR
jgi:hypothetical protein